MRILIVEDDPVLADGLTRSLRAAEYAVDSATDGITADHVLAAQTYDLVILDLGLPQIDGFEVLRRLRAQPETAALRCIALSANALPEDIERGLAAGFDDYWTKPIRFKPFLEALERLFPSAPPVA